MDIQQAINLALFEQFAAKGIEIAYPTQTVYLANNGDGRQEVGNSLKQTAA